MHFRLGGSGRVVSTAAMLFSIGLSWCSNAIIGLRPHAKAMHRLRPKPASAASGSWPLITGETLWVGIELTVFKSCRPLRWVKPLGVSSPSPWYSVAGSGGLGVLVRAGLVRPPSLVNSAVDGALAMLDVDTLERYGDALDMAGASALIESRFELVTSSRVRSDSLRLR